MPCSACHADAAAPGDSAADTSGGTGGTAAYDGKHPMDVAAALAAAEAGGGALLLWTLPWAARYLWFLRWDPQASHSPYFRCAE